MRQFQLGKHASTTLQGQVRIIGGSHRGRIIHFPANHDLRPTPNRIRETLFNWLAQDLAGATCLDLFAGSGALGFEAISRGADYCLMLDQSPEIIKALKENRTTLNFSSQKIEIIQSSFPYSAEIANNQFNIVFVDPPFHCGYIAKVVAWLDQSQCLKHQALIYIESEVDNHALSLPDDWQVLKDKRAGQVRYLLVRR